MKSHSTEEQGGEESTLGMGFRNALRMKIEWHIRGDIICENHADAKTSLKRELERLLRKCLADVG